MTFRPLGPSLILGGALASVAAMFLPFRSFGGQSLTWWEYANGLDIALIAACLAASGLALVALTSGRPRARQLAALAAGVTFGLAFAPVPAAIDYSEGTHAGLWIVGGTGAIALAGAVVTTLSQGDAPRRSLGWIVVPIAGAVLVAALAVANPFGDDDFTPRVPTPEEDFEVLDAGDASAFANTWARRRMRPGERPSVGCGAVRKTWPPRFECDIQYRERPPGYKVIRRRSSELHIEVVKPEIAYYAQDGTPDAARDRGRNRWRVISVISLGGESKLERKVRTALGSETDRADITRVECRRQSGRSYTCTAKLRSRRCRDTEVRDDPALTIDDIHFKPIRTCGAGTRTP